MACSVRSKGRVARGAGIGVTGLLGVRCGRWLIRSCVWAAKAFTWQVCEIQRRVRAGHLLASISHMIWACWACTACLVTV